MIVLRDTVDIDVPPETVADWLGAFCDRYVEWHPDRLSCSYIVDDGVAPGTVIEVEEVLHQKPHRLRMVITAAEPNRRVEYRIGPGLRGSFPGNPSGTGFASPLRCVWARPGPCSGGWQTV